MSAATPAPAAELRSLFSPAVRVAFARLDAYDLERGWSRLYPVERTAVERAVEKRRREFACGRELARRVLAELGFAPQAIESGSKREPLWPPGVVGSIAHTGGACVAVVAHSTDVLGLGVDVEPAESLPFDLRDRVLTPTERTALEGLPEARAGLLARAGFSAKESVYKAQFPLTGAWVDFHDVEVRFQSSTRFRADFLRTPAGLTAPAAWQGAWSARADWLLTAIELAPPDA